MNSQKTLSLFLFVCLTSMCSCQSALRKLVTLSEKRAAASTSNAPTVAVTVIDKEYLDYQFQVRSHFLQRTTPGLMRKHARLAQTNYGCPVATGNSGFCMESLKNRLRVRVPTPTGKT